MGLWLCKIKYVNLSNIARHSVFISVHVIMGMPECMQMQLPCKYTYFLQLSESSGESAYKRGCTGTGKPQNFNLP